MDKKNKLVINIAKSVLAIVVISGTILVCSSIIKTEERIKELQSELEYIKEDKENIDKNIDGLKDDYQSIMDHIFSQPYGYYTEEEQKMIQNEIDKMGE